MLSELFSYFITILFCETFVSYREAFRVLGYSAISLLKTVYLSDVIFHYARSVENKQTFPPEKKTKQNKIKNKSVITSCDRKTTTN